jgi:hypothetical protein
MGTAKNPATTFQYIMFKVADHSSFLDHRCILEKVPFFVSNATLSA